MFTFCYFLPTLPLLLDWNPIGFCTCTFSAFHIYRHSRIVFSVEVYQLLRHNCNCNFHECEFIKSTLQWNPFTVRMPSGVLVSGADLYTLVCVWNKINCPCYGVSLTLLLSVDYHKHITNSMRWVPLWYRSTSTHRKYFIFISCQKRNSDWKW